MGDGKLEKAKKRAKVKLDFYRHLGSFVMVMAILAVINNLTGPGYQWWLWPAGFWGIGLVSHFLRIFVFNQDLEQKLVEREMDEMDKGQD